MSALAYVATAIGFITVASLVIYWRQARPASLEHGVERFNTGLRRLGERQDSTAPPASGAPRGSGGPGGSSARGTARGKEVS